MRAPKVVLSNDARIVVGVPCMVKITAIHKADRPDRGSIEVEWAGPAPFKIEGVYLDPVVSRKLQVLLESGLNILLDGPQGCGKTVLARSIADTLGMEFVFFNCGAVIEATDFFATTKVRASSSGAPVTDFVKTEVLTAMEAAAEQDDGGPDLPRRAQPLPGVGAQRADAGARRDPADLSPDRERFMEIPANVQFIAAVNRGASSPDLRDRRRPARPLRAAANDLPAAARRGQDPRSPPPAGLERDDRDHRRVRRRGPRRSRPTRHPQRPRDRRGVHLPRAPAVQ